MCDRELDANVLSAKAAVARVDRRRAAADVSAKCSCPRISDTIRAAVRTDMIVAGIFSTTRTGWSMECYVECVESCG